VDNGLQIQLEEYGDGSTRQRKMVKTELDGDDYWSAACVLLRTMMA